MPRGIIARAAVEFKDPGTAAFGGLSALFGSCACAVRRACARRSREGSPGSPGGSPRPRRSLLQNEPPSACCCGPPSPYSSRRLRGLSLKADSELVDTGKITKRAKTLAKILVGLVGVVAVIGIASALTGGGNAENASSPSSAEAIPAEATSVAVTSEATPAGESYGGLLTEAEAENAATFFLIYPGYSDIYGVADCHGVGGEIEGHFASFHCTGFRGEDLVPMPVVVDVMGFEPDNPNVLVEVRAR